MGGTAFHFWSINASPFVFFSRRFWNITSFSKSSHRCVHNRGLEGASYLFWLLIFRGLVSGNSSPWVSHACVRQSRASRAPVQRVVNRKTATSLWTNFPSRDHITETPVLPWQFDVGCLWFITSARWQSSNRHEAISEQFSLSVNSFWLGACFECQVN